VTFRTLLLTGLCCTSAAAAPPETLFEQEDPPGDSDGPGSYSPPTDADLQGGSFDLRKFVARVEGDVVVLEVTLGEAVRPPDSVLRTNATPVQLDNGIYLQNIDIYVDTDPSPSAKGVSTCIPGRRVAFADGRTWKRAIVLTPQPSLVSSIVEGALRDSAWRVAYPGPLVNRGRTLVARVPVAFFGAKPRREWGWSVQVSGAAWQRSFQAVDQVRGTAKADALTMPVSTTAERWEFGGAELGHAHPQVVDVLVPPGVDQHQVLSGFNNDTGEYARVPFAYGRPPPPPPMAVAPESPQPEAPKPAPVTAAATTAAQPPGWSVVDVAGEIVSIRGATAGVTPMMFGQVLDAAGGVLARVVVMQVLPGGIVASAVDGREKIAAGAQVRFALKPKE
jgi:carbohydrate-binding DOMON domain-containing protein